MKKIWNWLKQILSDIRYFLFFSSWLNFKNGISSFFYFLFHSFDVLRLRNKKLKLQKKQILSQTGADQTSYNDVKY